VPENLCKVHRIGGRCSGPDEAIGKLAARQHGVVARRQLLDAGLTSRIVETRVANGRLLRLHHGVYAVGHRQLRREGHWLAAVLAVPRGVLSHREAATLHGFRDSGRRTVDVETTASVRRTLAPGLIVHRAVLDPADVTARSGIPVTTPARTLVDLSALLTADQLRKTLREADRIGGLDPHAVREALERARRSRGAAGRMALTTALGDHERIAASFTRSELEGRFLALLDAHDLPRPLTNHPIAGMEVDAAWPRQRLVVELDGWAFHHDRRTFHDDRTRTARLMSAGYAVVRFTHAHVTQQPAWVVDTVRGLLAAARATMSDPCR
jgi:hypothetical protein